MRSIMWTNAATKTPAANHHVAVARYLRALNFIIMKWQQILIDYTLSGRIFWSVRYCLSAMLAAMTAVNWM